MTTRDAAQGPSSATVMLYLTCSGWPRTSLTDSSSTLIGIRLSWSYATGSVLSLLLAILCGAMIKHPRIEVRLKDGPGRPLHLLGRAHLVEVSQNTGSGLRRSTRTGTSYCFFLSFVPGRGIRVPLGHPVPLTYSRPPAGRQRHLPPGLFRGYRHRPFQADRKLHGDVVRPPAPSRARAPFRGPSGGVS